MAMRRLFSYMPEPRIGSTVLVTGDEDTDNIHFTHERDGFWRCSLNCVACQRETDRWGSYWNIFDLGRPAYYFDPSEREALWLDR